MSVSFCKQEENPVYSCTCTVTTCKRHGKCCECVAYHRNKGAIPGCFFTEKGEALLDRSLETFFQDRKKI
jgi:hypothetical protein